MTRSLVSIHAPLRREERRGCSIEELLPEVSIHAPLRREERRYVDTDESAHDLFQSTPPSGERSDPETACHWC